MSDRSAIEWTDATWNPTVGCSIVSPGCTNCYAMRVAWRLHHAAKYAGLTRLVNGTPVWTGEVRLDESALTQPLRWQRPRRIFVNSMSDLFHEWLPDEAIDKVFAVMALAPQHIFQVLTKRARRMRDYVSRMEHEPFRDTVRRMAAAMPNPMPDFKEMLVPPPNLWLGVSVERQQDADVRIPLLLATPAAVRFLSCEPLLGPIDLTAIRRTQAEGFMRPLDGRFNTVHWVIVGGESGPGARPMHPDWARGLRDQCQAAGVPFFFKQWGEWIDADEQLDSINRIGGSILNLGQPWNPARPLNFDDAATVANIGGHRYDHRSDGTTAIRVGKHSAGRLLDGREWNEFPAGNNSPVPGAAP